jgi:hypothetical protein
MVMKNHHVLFLKEERKRATINGKLSVKNDVRGSVVCDGGFITCIGSAVGTKTGSTT